MSCLGCCCVESVIVGACCGAVVAQLVVLSIETEGMDCRYLLVKLVNVVVVTETSKH